MYTKKQDPTAQYFHEVDNYNHLYYSPELLLEPANTEGHPYIGKKTEHKESIVIKPKYVSVQKMDSIDQNKTTFVLFVNPSSGGNKAGIFMNIEVDHLVFKLKQGMTQIQRTADVYFINLKDNANRDYGLSVLKTQLTLGNRVRAIVCGGDGTVMWVVEELVRANIDTNQCPIGIIPFGTGNDFSRVLGWGPTAPSSLIGSQLQDLKGMAKRWLDASVLDFDIWEVTVTLNDVILVSIDLKSRGDNLGGS